MVHLEQELRQEMRRLLAMRPESIVVLLFSVDINEQGWRKYEPAAAILATQVVCHSAGSLVDPVFTVRAETHGGNAPEHVVTLGGLDVDDHLAEREGAGQLRDDEVLQAAIDPIAIVPARAAEGEESAKWGMLENTLHYVRKRRMVNGQGAADTKT